MCTKEMTIDQFLLRSLPTKILRIIENLERKELFEILFSDLKNSNMSREEWQAVRFLADDRNIMIKKADKGSCVVVWDRNNYLVETQRALSDTKVDRDVSDTKNILSKLSEANNKMF